MNKILRQAQEWLLKELPDIWAIYHFGSFNTQYEKPDSDIDLAVLLPNPIHDKKIFFTLQNNLAVFLQKDCDLIDLRSASTVLQFQIISTGERIFSSNTQQSDAFETLIIAMYWRLNEERKDILKDIKKRGSVL